MIVEQTFHYDLKLVAANFAGDDKELANIPYVSLPNSLRTDTYIYFYIFLLSLQVSGVFLCCPFSHVMSWMRSGT